MAFVLNSHITIGDFAFKGVHELHISKGIHSYVDTCTIKLPVSARLTQKDSTTTSVQLANQFKRGEKVLVKLGYNGELHQEFEGFVNHIDVGSPLEIECHGYVFQLRTRNINKVYAKGTTIRNVCEDLVKGTGITLSNAIPQIKLGSDLRVANQNATKVLDYLKSKMRLTVYFHDKELYVGLQETNPRANVKYKFGWNTVKDSGLKYRVADEHRVKIILKTAQSDGGKAVYTTGDGDGDVHEYIVHKNMAQSEMKMLAEDELKKLKFTGFEGKFSTLLYPRIKHGDSAEIEDPRYAERSGTYFVPSVDVYFGQQGARRVPGLGNKLSN